MSNYKRPFFVSKIPIRLGEKKFQHENLEGGDSPEGCARDIERHFAKYPLADAQSFTILFIVGCHEIYDLKQAQGDFKGPQMELSEFDHKVRAEIKRLEQN